MRPLWSHATGLTFGKDDLHSADCAHILELVMRHENAFSNWADSSRTSIQIAASVLLVILGVWAIILLVK